MPQRYSAQLILIGVSMSRLNREVKDFSVPGLSPWGTDPGQSKDAWQCFDKAVQSVSLSKAPRLAAMHRELEHF